MTGGKRTLPLPLLLAVGGTPAAAIGGAAQDLLERFDLGGTHSVQGPRSSRRERTEGRPLDQVAMRRRHGADTRRRTGPVSRDREGARRLVDGPCSPASGERSASSPHARPGRRSRRPRVGRSRRELAVVPNLACPDWYGGCPRGWTGAAFCRSASPWRPRNARFLLQSKGPDDKQRPPAAVPVELAGAAITGQRHRGRRKGLIHHSRRDSSHRPRSATRTRPGCTRKRAKPWQRDRDLCGQKCEGTGRRNTQKKTSPGGDKDTAEERQSG